MADPAPSAKFNLHAPVFDGGDAESFNLWLSQFQRYIRVTKPAEDDKLDLFLLCAGNKAAQYQGIQYLRFLVLVLSTFGIGIGIGIESIPGLVNGIDPIVNWY